jgi:hypothetical protein
MRCGSKALFLTTIGHATLLVSESAQGAPLIATDPWLIGSCYWRSWWLERYPTAQQVERLRSAENIYFTHEHPDHFHTPSIRRIGNGPRALVPELSRDSMGSYMRARGMRAEVLPAGAWVPLRDGVRVLSLPTVANDSALLIDTPTALILNMNDARPTPDQLLILRSLRRHAGRDKRCVLLSSYSGAGIGSSFFRKGVRVDFAGKGSHARYVRLLAQALEVDAYIPFASHVRFERPDTRWANAFRVPVQAVEDELAKAGVPVLPAYVTLDLDTFEHTHEDTSFERRELRIEERVSEQLAREEARLSGTELAQLEDKLNAAARLWLPLLFPRGLAFELGGQRLVYRLGKVRESASAASVTLKLPAQPVKDVLMSGFFSDLCIPMFTEVHLGPEAPPHSVYAFFVLMQLHDVGVTQDVRALARSLSMSATERMRLLRAARG